MRLPRRSSIQNKFIKILKGAINVEIPNMQKDFNVLQENVSAETVTNLGHFSSLCYKKKQDSHKKESRTHKAYQLYCGRLPTADSSISSQSSDTSFSEDEPFCLQMKVQENKPHTSVQVPKHLVNNLEFKVQLHKRKTKF